MGWLGIAHGPKHLLGSCRSLSPFPCYKMRLFFGRMTSGLAKTWFAGRWLWHWGLRWAWPHKTCSCSPSWAVGAWVGRVFESYDFDAGRLFCQTPPSSDESMSANSKWDQSPDGLRRGTGSSRSHLPAQLQGCVCATSWPPRGSL